MTHKKNSLALERLALKKTELLTESLPEELLEEIKRFSKRNAILFGDGKTVCCERCLKAHITKKFYGKKFSSEAIEFVNKNLNCETGHNGYYLDKDKVVEI